MAGMQATHRRSLWTVITLYRDGILPADVPPDEIARLTRKGMIEELTFDAG